MQKRKACAIALTSLLYLAGCGGNDAPEQEDALVQQETVSVSSTATSKDREGTAGIILMISYRANRPIITDSANYYAKLVRSGAIDPDSALHHFNHWLDEYEAEHPDIEADAERVDDSLAAASRAEIAREKKADRERWQRLQDSIAKLAH
jgi:hypothetical protein